MRIDAVVPMHRVTCTTGMMIRALQTHFRPRRLYLLTRPENCPRLRALVNDNESNAVCINQNRVIPNVSLSAIRALILRTGHASDVVGGFGGHSTAGWYLQQLLKLGMGISTLNVSSRYLVWDADAIMLRDFYPRWGTSLENKRGDPLPFFTFERCARTYTRTLSKLLQSPLTATRVGHVVHSMVMDSSIIDEMLTHICQTPRWGDRWVEAIVNASCVSQSNAYCDMGFSEYESFARWVREFSTIGRYRVAGHHRYIVRRHVWGCCPSMATLDDYAGHGEPFVMFEGGCQT